VKRVALLLLVLACQKTDAPPAAGSGNGPRPGTQLKVGPKPGATPEADPCARVADGIRAIWDRQVRDAEPGPERKAAEDMRHKLAGRLERHCRDDGWSVEAIDCIRSGSPCRGKLTAEQQAKLDADKPDAQ
jgi:hypothetical protein